MRIDKLQNRYKGTYKGYEITVLSNCFVNPVIPESCCQSHTCLVEANVNPSYNPFPLEK